MLATRSTISGSSHVAVTCVVVYSRVFTAMEALVKWCLITWPAACCVANVIKEVRVLTIRKASLQPRRDDLYRV